MLQISHWPLSSLNSLSKLIDNYFSLAPEEKIKIKTFNEKIHILIEALCAFNKDSTIEANPRDIVFNLCEGLTKNPPSEQQNIPCLQAFLQSPIIKTYDLFNRMGLNTPELFERLILAPSLYSKITAIIDYLAADPLLAPRFGLINFKQWFKEETHYIDVIYNLMCFFDGPNKSSNMQHLLHSKHPHLIYDLIGWLNRTSSPHDPLISKIVCCKRPDLLHKLFEIIYLSESPAEIHFSACIDWLNTFNEATISGDLPKLTKNIEIITDRMKQALEHLYQAGLLSNEYAGRNIDYFFKHHSKQLTRLTEKKDKSCDGLSQFILGLRAEGVIIDQNIFCLLLKAPHYNKLIQDAIPVLQQTAVPLAHLQKVIKQPNPLISARALKMIQERDLLDSEFISIYLEKMISAESPLDYAQAYIKFHQHQWIILGRPFKFETVLNCNSPLETCEVVSALDSMQLLTLHHFFLAKIHARELKSAIDILTTTFEDPQLRQKYTEQILAPYQDNLPSYSSINAANGIQRLNQSFCLTDEFNQDFLKKLLKHADCVDLTERISRLKVHHSNITDYTKDIHTIFDAHPSRSRTIAAALVCLHEAKLADTLFINKSFHDWVLEQKDPHSSANAFVQLKVLIELSEKNKSTAMGQKLSIIICHSKAAELAEAFSYLHKGEKRDLLETLKRYNMIDHLLAHSSPKEYLQALEDLARTNNLESVLAEINKLPDNIQTYPIDLQTEHCDPALYAKIIILLKPYRCIRTEENQLSAGFLRLTHDTNVRQWYSFLERMISTNLLDRKSSYTRVKTMLSSVLTQEIMTNLNINPYDDSYFKILAPLISIDDWFIRNPPPLNHETIHSIQMILELGLLTKENLSVIYPEWRLELKVSVSTKNPNNEINRIIKKIYDAYQEDPCWKIYLPYILTYVKNYQCVLKQGNIDKSYFENKPFFETLFLLQHLGILNESRCKELSEMEECSTLIQLLYQANLLDELVLDAIINYKDILFDKKIVSLWKNFPASSSVNHEALVSLLLKAINHFKIDPFKTDPVKTFIDQIARFKDQSTPVPQQDLSHKIQLPILDLDAERIQAEPIQAEVEFNIQRSKAVGGICAKYLGGRLSKLPEMTDIKITSSSSPFSQFKHSLPLIPVQDCQYESHKDSEERHEIDFQKDEDGTFIHTTRYTYDATLKTETKPIYIFAGRKENARIPDIIKRKESSIHVILVCPKVDETQMLPYVQPGIDVLIINQLSSRTHGDYQEYLGLVNTRRIAGFISSIQLCALANINYAMMLDDNIESISYQHESDESDWEDFFVAIARESEKKRAVCVSLATISNLGIRKTQRGELGSKVYGFNTQLLKQKLNGELNLSFMPFYPANCSRLWGEDYYFQLMFQSLFDNEYVGYQILDTDQFGIQRSGKIRSVCTKTVAPVNEIYLETLVMERLFEPSIIDIMSKINFYSATARLKTAALCINEALGTLRRVIQDNLDIRKAQEQTLALTDLLRSHAQANDIRMDATPDYSTKDEHNAGPFLGAFAAKIQQLENLILLSKLEIPLRPYQKEIIKKVSECIASNNVIGQIEMATGTGKTYIQIYLSILALLTKSRRPIVIVTPFKQLVQQTYSDFLSVLDNFDHKLSVNKQNILKIDSDNQSLSINLLQSSTRLEDIECVMIFCQDSYEKFLDTRAAERHNPCMVLIDESHKQMTLFRKMRRHSDCFIAALSATPNNEIDLATPYPFFIRYDRQQAINDYSLAPCILDRFNTNYSREQVIEKITAMPTFLKRQLTPKGKGIDETRRLSEEKGIIYVPNNYSYQEGDITIQKNYSSLLKTALEEAGIFCFEINSEDSKKSQENIRNYKSYNELTKPCVLICKGMLKEGFSDNETRWIIYLKDGNEIEFCQSAGRTMRRLPTDPYKIAYVIGFNDVKSKRVFPEEHVTADEAAIKMCNLTYKSQRLLGRHGILSQPTDKKPILNEAGMKHSGDETINPAKKPRTDLVSFFADYQKSSHEDDDFDANQRRSDAAPAKSLW